MASAAFEDKAEALGGVERGLGRCAQGSFKAVMMFQAGCLKLRTDCFCSFRFIAHFFCFFVTVFSGMHVSA